MQPKITPRSFFVFFQSGLRRFLCANIIHHYSVTIYRFFPIGRAHAASVLLDNEAPAGVYDDKGTSAMTHMVEKMPNVAYAALAQFYVDDKALRRKYFYLNQLESEKNQKATNKNYAKTALEVHYFPFLHFCTSFYD